MEPHNYTPKRLHTTRERSNKSHDHFWEARRHRTASCGDCQRDRGICRECRTTLEDYFRTSAFGFRSCDLKSVLMNATRTRDALLRLLWFPNISKNLLNDSSSFMIKHSKIFGVSVLSIFERIISISSSAESSKLSVLFITSQNKLFAKDIFIVWSMVLRNEKSDRGFGQRIRTRSNWLPSPHQALDFSPKLTS